MTIPGIRAVRSGPVDVAVSFDDGTEATYNRYWLRDNGMSRGDRASLFRPASVADLPDDLAVVGARVGASGDLEIDFSDGVTDSCPPDLLVAHGPSSHRSSSHRSRSWQPWRSGFEPVRTDMDSLDRDDAAQHDLLEAVVRDGFALVDGLAADDTERLAALLGPIRQTDFGRIFDIISEPDPFTPSQSEDALDPHTDDPYRYAPPGVSILHCVSPCGGEGGASSIVDGFAIATHLAASDPSAFRTLATTCIPYVHRRDADVDQGDAVYLRAEAPVIALDPTGEVCGIRFHERSMAPLDLPADDVEDVYRALMLFARAALGDEFVYRRRLSAGEAIVYDNQRVMHGRTAIVGGTDRRHLRLCTIDRDQVHSRVRRLRARFAPAGVDAPLPAGNLA